MRRCSVSVVSNIAEGFNRRTPGEKHQFYTYAQGSVSELNAQILVAKDVGYLTETDFQTLEGLCTESHRLIGGLIKSQKKT